MTKPTTMPITNLFASEEELKLEAVVKYPPFSGPSRMEICIESLITHIPNLFLEEGVRRGYAGNIEIMKGMITSKVAYRNRVFFDRTIPVFTGDQINIYFRDYPQLESEFNFPDAIEIMDKDRILRRALYVSGNTVTF